MEMHDGATTDTGGTGTDTDGGSGVEGTVPEGATGEADTDN